MARIKNLEVNLPKVDKGIPIPLRDSKSKKIFDLVSTMKQSDSLFAGTPAGRAQVTVAMNKQGIQAVVRKESTGFRIWHGGPKRQHNKKQETTKETKKSLVKKPKKPNALKAQNGINRNSVESLLG